MLKLPAPEESVVSMADAGVRVYCVRSFIPVVPDTQEMVAPPWGAPSSLLCTVRVGERGVVIVTCVTPVVPAGLDDQLLLSLPSCIAPVLSAQVRSQ